MKKQFSVIKGAAKLLALAFPARTRLELTSLALTLALAFLTIPAFSQSKTPALPRNLPTAEAVEAGDILYISGHIGFDPATDTLVTSSFRAEVKQAMENIGQVLKKHDLSYSDLVNVTIYLTDMSRYAETNDVYRQYFTTTTSYPARICIGVKQLPLNANIEISAMARLSWVQYH